MSDIKTFDDLEFSTHPCGRGIRAEMHFSNGFGVSVISGDLFYSSKKGEYELAVWHSGDLHYENPVARGDVRGYLRSWEVTDLMKRVQEFQADQSFSDDQWKGDLK